MKIFFIFLFAVSLLISCTPKPIVINIKEAPDQLCVSSATPNDQTVIVALTYSITSLTNVNDFSTGQNTSGIPEGILVNNATVTIKGPNAIYTLSQVTPGIYSNTSMVLQNGVTYSLQVKDNLRQKSISASTTYRTSPLPVLTPVVTRNPGDTTIKLNLTVTDNAPEMEYYVLAYDKINPATAPSGIGSAGFAVINKNAIKRVEVFSDADAVNNVITKSYNITGLNATDTLFAHFGKVDVGYYNYLKAYKRSGSLVSQITSEPITLPTNIVTGLGYFALYEVEREIFNLPDY